MAMNVGKELADLREMSVRELREKYEAVFGEPTRAGNKDWLFKRIAWRIQALAEGDLSERARQRAEFLARDADLRTTAPREPLAASGGNGVGGAANGNGVGHAKPSPPLADERVPPPGTVLTRVYRGQAYHVVVRNDGFEYDGAVNGWSSNWPAIPRTDHRHPHLSRASLRRRSCCSGGWSTGLLITTMWHLTRYNTIHERR